MAARAALVRSVRPLLLRRGVATTAPAAASAAVTTTGASLRAELEKLQRFSPNLPEGTAEMLMTPEVRADVAAISTAEEALIATIDTTDVSVDWVGCPIFMVPLCPSTLFGRPRTRCGRGGCSSSVLAVHVRQDASFGADLGRVERGGAQPLLVLSFPCQYSRAFAAAEGVGGMHRAGGCSTNARDVVHASDFPGFIAVVGL